MARTQGRYFSKEEIGRITYLLAETDMTIPQIAQRMGCARSSVAVINRRFAIRLYEGRRSQWLPNFQRLEAQAG